MTTVIATPVGKKQKRQDSTRTPQAKQESMRRRAVRRDIRVLGFRQGV